MQTTKIETALRDITPEDADQFLLCNRKNRPLKSAAVDTYVRDIKAGNWRVTHQGIAFAENGDLLDGQHRLQAVVESGVTVRMLVTTGLPVEQGQRKTMDVVDQGIPRSVADQLRLSHGATGRVNLLVAICARIVAVVFGSAIKKLSTPQCVELLSIYGPSVEKVLNSMERCAIKPLFRAPVLGGLAFAHAAFPTEIEAFMDDLVQEHKGPATTPAQRLHDAIWEQSVQGDVPYTPKDRREESVQVLKACAESLAAETAPEDLVSFFSAGQATNIADLQTIFFAAPLNKKVVPPPRLVGSSEIHISPAAIAPDFTPFPPPPAIPPMPAVEPARPQTEGEAFDAYSDAVSGGLPSQIIRDLEARWLELKGAVAV